jgi:hypothetical protein
MSDRELMEKVTAALKSFFDNDGQLLKLNASERSISHKLAEHLEKEFLDWDVDCEYNRRGERPKTLPRILFSDIKDDDQEAKTIFPDIIVHKRNQPDNLLVVEVKKSNSRESDDKDRTKLMAFTDPEGDYSYKVGLFIVFDVENQKVDKVQCFENGGEVALDINIKNNLETLVYGK